MKAQTEQQPSKCKQALIGLCLLIVIGMMVGTTANMCGYEPDTREQWNPRYCIERAVACDADWMPVDCPACTPTSHWKH